MIADILTRFNDLLIGKIGDNIDFNIVDIDINLMKGTINIDYIKKDLSDEMYRNEDFKLTTNYEYDQVSIPLVDVYN